MPSAFEAIGTAAILVDLVVPLLVVHVLGQKSASFRAWYLRFGASAVAMDVLSMIWGTLLARSLVGGQASLGTRIAAAIGVQVVHDLAFAYIVARFAKSSAMLQTFYEYQQEHGYWILLIDACMMACVVVAADWMEGRSDLALVASTGLYLLLLASHTLY